MDTPPLAIRFVLASQIYFTPKEAFSSRFYATAYSILPSIAGGLGQFNNICTTHSCRNTFSSLVPRIFHMGKLTQPLRIVLTIIFKNSINSFPSLRTIKLGSNAMLTGTKIGFKQNMMRDALKQVHFCDYRSFLPSNIFQIAPLESSIIVLNKV